MHSGTEVVIRPCRAGDLAALEHFLPAEGENHRSRWSDPDGVYLVAFLGREPVGHLLVRRTSAYHQVYSPTRAEISRVFVAPHRQGLGIGRRLMHEAERHAHALGREEVGLAVDVDNSTAQALYESLGYREVLPGHTFDSVKKPGASTVRYMAKSAGPSLEWNAMPTVQAREAAPAPVALPSIGVALA